MVRWWEEEGNGKKGRISGELEAKSGGGEMCVTIDLTFYWQTILRFFWFFSPRFCCRFKFQLLLFLWQDNSFQMANNDSRQNQPKNNVRPIENHGGCTWLPVLDLECRLFRIYTPENQPINSERSSGAYLTNSSFNNFLRGETNSWRFLLRYVKPMFRTRLTIWVNSLLRPTTPTWKYVRISILINFDQEVFHHFDLTIKVIWEIKKSSHRWGPTSQCEPQQSQNGSSADQWSWCGNLLYLQTTLCTWLIYLMCRSTPSSIEPSTKSTATAGKSILLRCRKLLTWKIGKIFRWFVDCKRCDLLFPWRPL